MEKTVGIRKVVQNFYLRCKHCGYIKGVWGMIRYSCYDWDGLLKVLMENLDATTYTKVVETLYEYMGPEEFTEIKMTKEGITEVRNAKKI